ncbi:MAG: hypothetical protein KUG58_12240 [Marinosulfonomonas sp.]|nr:hypothetical protein [Marinosulfonomonas sp.]
MKPSFALILSHDGIRLLRRATNGWRCVGEVAPDDPDLSKQLKYLRQTATDLSGGKFSTKLVLPNSQILYTKIDALGASHERREQEIRKGMEGLTPYQVEDLYFDWCDAGGGYAHVAIVARETLEEAETFALKHRMNPVSFVATPEDGGFTKEIFFGATGHSHSLLSDGELVEPDHDIIAEINQSERPDAPVVDDAQVLATPPADNLTAGQSNPDQPNLTDDPEHCETDAPAQSDDTSDLTFSTRRQSGRAQSDEEPLRLKWIAPRIAITASAELTDNSPHEQAEVVPVTAPALDAGKIPKAYLAEQESLVAPKRALTVPPAPVADATQPMAQLVSSQREQEARALTIFGARNRTKPGERPRRPSLSITVGLAAAIAAIVFVSGILVETPITSARFWRGDNANGPGLTAQAVVASSGFLEDTAPPAKTPQTDKVEVAIEIASLTAPDISTDAMIALTPEEAAEATSAAPLTPPEAAAAYAVSGIWQRAPLPPGNLATDRIDNVYVASIDRAVVSNDAVALLSHSAIYPDKTLAQTLPPPPLGTVFDLDERGLVKATPTGALTPDGIRVFAGKPAIVPSLRPGTSPAISGATARPAELSADLAALAKVRPILRPANLIEQNEKERFGGRSLAEIGKVRPVLRPASEQDRGQVTTSPAASVVLSSSRVPTSRPDNFQSAVQKALAEALAQTSEKPDVVVTSAATVTRSAPSIPTKASVATEATQKNAINLSAINLIGVYGSANERRALVRLKSGRYVKVQVGDRLDGGRVDAISAVELLYTKGKRNLKLKLPTG